MALHREPHPTQGRLERIMSPDYPMCLEDAVWILEYIKKKVADEAPELLALPQPRLLKNFQSFAEASMLLIKHRVFSTEADRLRRCLAEALFGLLPESESR
ncbi:hypothetical protein [Paenibacillus humicola]|uniref:hypothetical protein n=1 Tax=Paenibacillus humicola TaxID=3110540 RepID=UPI00237A1AC1|nr:hypothetical protein [Paenibacillus humicola]